MESRMLTTSVKPRVTKRQHSRRESCNHVAIQRSLVTAHASSATDVASYQWTGVDDFSHLQDRFDLPPLSLPTLTEAKRVVLVRHGQSTWNAEGRIQGSTNFAVLSEKGQAQAHTTCEMGPTECMPALREVDLYSFQGLLKAEGKARYGAEFLQWQKAPADFAIDGHKPVRELWYRASMAWQSILSDPEAGECVLVVAHNAVNQALICTALGFSPTFFRRLLQSNAASTVIDFVPNPKGGSPNVTVDRLNQSPGRPFEADGAGLASRARLVLVRHGATDLTEAGRIPGPQDQKCSSLGEVQAHKVGEFLMDMKIDSMLTSPMHRAVYTSAVISKCQGLGWDRSPRVQELHELTNFDAGAFNGKSVKEIQLQPLPPDCEDLDAFWERTGRAWQHAVQAAGSEGGVSVCVVAHAAVHSALLCHCLGLGKDDLRKFRMSTAGISVIDFPFGTSAHGVVRTHNYTAHLGRWAVPISRDDEIMVCGIDGCF